MLPRNNVSCPIVSTMKQVTQGSIIPQRMTINLILIYMKIIDHDLAMDRAKKHILADYNK